MKTRNIDMNEDKERVIKVNHFVNKREVVYADLIHLSPLIIGFILIFISQNYGNFFLQVISIGITLSISLFLLLSGIYQNSKLYISEKGLRLVKGNKSTYVLWNNIAEIKSETTSHTIINPPIYLIIKFLDEKKRVSIAIDRFLLKSNYCRFFKFWAMVATEDKAKHLLPKSFDQLLPKKYPGRIKRIQSDENYF